MNDLWLLDYLLLGGRLEYRHIWRWQLRVEKLMLLDRECAVKDLWLGRSLRAVQSQLAIGLKSESKPCVLLRKSIIL